MTARHFRLTETAKMIRAELKRRWPDVIFSVRCKSYSMGGHIDISWTDGPATRTVETVTAPYSSSRFDASCDGSYHVDSWLLPDGRVILATKGADGYHRGTLTEAPEGAELVSFSGSTPSCSRELSAKWIASCEMIWSKLSVREHCALLNNGRFPRLDVSNGHKLAYFLDEIRA